jgi:hypothetical protein
MNAERQEEDMPEPRTWQGMWARYAARLEEQTGDGVEAWAARIRDAAPADEAALRSWLDERGVTGYPQMLLVMEHFGWPDFLQMTDAELIAGQYADREHLRPILDAVLGVTVERHPDVEIVARKGYVPLHTPRRQFAVVKPTTQRRVDLGLRLDGEQPHGRLVAAKSLANDTINVRIPLAAIDEVDGEVVAWLDRAWERNL